MPGLAKAAPRAVVSNLQGAQALRLQFTNFGFQPLATLHQIRPLLRVAKVNLIDDGQHRNLKQYGVQPRALDRHLDLARGQCSDAYILFIELEDSQKINEVSLDKAHGLEVSQLCVLKPQIAQAANLFANLVDVRRKLSLVAALETVFNLGARKLMQHHLHHGEFVQVGVEQACNDHGHIFYLRVIANLIRNPSGSKQNLWTPGQARDYSQEPGSLQALHLTEKIHFEQQRGIRRNHAARAARAVTQVCRNNQATRTTHRHALHAFVPAFDNLTGT